MSVVSWDYFFDGFHNGTLNLLNFLLLVDFFMLKISGDLEKHGKAEMKHNLFFTAYIIYKR